MSPPIPQDTILVDRATRALNALTRRGWSMSAERLVLVLETLAARAERPGAKEQR